MVILEEEIFRMVRDEVADSLDVGADEVTREASLGEDFGAEAIDYLDIIFKLESRFGVKIPRGEFLDDYGSFLDYVSNGRVNEKGIAELRGKYPFFEWDRLEKDPRVERIPYVITVRSLVKYLQNKLREK